MLKKQFGNIPEELQNLNNWVLCNNKKAPINVNFIMFTEEIKDDTDRLIKVYDYIVSNDLNPKLDTSQQTNKKACIDLSSYDTFIKDLSNKVSDTPKETYNLRLFKKICYKCLGADTSNPKTFTTFNNVINLIQNKPELIQSLKINDNCIGFELLNTPYFCIDIDKDKPTGHLTDYTFDYAKRFNTYTEISQSGCGIHIIGIGDKIQNKCKNTDLDIEIYDTNRYIALTGDLLVLPDYSFDKIENRKEELNKLEKEIFSISDLSSEPKPDIEKIIKQLLENDNNNQFRDIFYNGKLLIGSNGLEDDSSTDQALVDRIATITNNPDTIKDIWLKSEHTKKRQDKNKLNRLDYINRTIEKGLNYAYSKGFVNSDETNTEKSKSPCNPLDFANYLKSQITDLIYIPQYQNNGYFLYNGNYWVQITNNECITYLGDYVKLYCKNLSSDTEYQKYFKKLKTPDALKQVLVFLQAYITKNTPDIFNKEKYLLCVKNGVVNLKTGELLPFNKDYYFNNIIDINYNPDTDFTEFKFIKALNDIFDTEDKEDTKATINCIQRILGYALTGDISLHKIFIWVGKGRNGKSFLQNILLKILGNYGITGQTQSILLDRWGSSSKSHLVIDIKDKRTVFYNEFNQCQNFDIGRLKNISGGDILTGDAKYTNTINFNPTCKVFLTSNYIPCFDSNDSAFINRLVVIPFNNVFSSNPEDISKGAKELIPNLDTILLKEEKEKIFNWIIKGAIALYQSDCDLKLSELIKAKTKEVITEFNPLGDFLNLCNPIGRVSRKNIYLLYQQFFKNKEEPTYKRQKDFINALCNSNWNITKPNNDTHNLNGISINCNNEWIKENVLLDENNKPSLNSKGNIQFIANYND